MYKEKEKDLVLKTNKKNKSVEVVVDYHFNVITIRTSINEKYKYYKKFLGRPDDILYNDNDEPSKVIWIKPLSEIDMKFIRKM